MGHHKVTISISAKSPFSLWLSIYGIHTIADQNKDGHKPDTVLGDYCYFNKSCFTKMNFLGLILPKLFSLNT